MDGVLIVRVVPIEVSGVRNKAGIFEEIVIRVYRRSEKSVEVAAFYEKAPKRSGHSCDSYAGEFACEASDGRIVLTLRPGRHQRSFLRPEFLEALYSMPEAP